MGVLACICVWGMGVSCGLYPRLSPCCEHVYICVRFCMCLCLCGFVGPRVLGSLSGESVVCVCGCMFVFSKVKYEALSESMGMKDEGRKLCPVPMPSQLVIRLRRPLPPDCTDFHQGRGHTQPQEGSLVRGLWWQLVQNLGCGMLWVELWPRFIC